jgi:hypothetical protein
MAFNYECNFYLQAQRLTPIVKRQAVRLGLLECISEGVQWNRDNFFDEYLEGDSSAVWDISTAYVKEDRVNYQNRIYYCIADNTGNLPTDTTYWTQVVADFRGATERIKYNFQKIMLEWILNKWFAATFRQPSTGLDSDFYIVSNDRDGEVFYASEESVLDGVFQPSVVPQFASQMEDFIGETATFTAGANFTVFYPVATIPLITDDKYYQMVALMDKYKIAGSTVEYISY